MPNCENQFYMISELIIIFFANIPLNIKKGSNCKNVTLVQKSYVT